MNYNYLTNTPLDDAAKGYIDRLVKSGMAYKTERICVADALDRVTAAAVYAKLCVPHYTASAMDGIAVKASATYGATETTPVFLSPQDFIPIDTGDPLPDGCDAVVMIEDVVPYEGGVRLFSAVTPWQNVRQIGEDICAGDMLLQSLTRITPAAMGAMLAGGIMQLDVVKQPTVGIIPTGDEIIPPCDNPQKGEILEFNSTIFTAMLSQWGAVSKTYPIVRDNIGQMEKALHKAIGECDAVIMIAGSSAGQQDYTAAVIGSVAQVFLHGVAIKPGKPAILGNSGPIPVLGVPGYPVSGIIVLEKLFKGVIDRLCGVVGAEPVQVSAVLGRRINSSLKYREFVRAGLGLINGKLVAVPLQRGAGIVTSFVKANAIIDVAQDSEGIEAGDTIKVTLLRPMAEIIKTVSVVGSHDPLVDEAADLLRLLDWSIIVASSHVGSMGGIMAIKRGEAHLGGIHLLDEDTGTYNTPYLKKHFPQGGVVLVEGVARLQGFMVAKGNPKGITGWKEIQGKKLSYVNRQKGSGTRILCDYLAKQQGINTSEIIGYDREEFTHTNVAALVAEGSADVGLGIYSAAKLNNLDFIPMCSEQYDILVLESAWQNPWVQKFTGVLRSEAFAKRLEKMGGYTLGKPGTVRTLDL